MQRVRSAGASKLTPNTIQVILLCDMLEQYASTRLGISRNCMIGLPDYVMPASLGSPYVRYSVFL